MKTKQLKRLREIEKEVPVKVISATGIISKLYMKERNSFRNKLLKELQEIKDNWKDGCGKIFEDKFWGKRRCGEMEDLKHSDHYILCPSCEKQNKEFKEICERFGK